MVRKMSFNIRSGLILLAIAILAIALVSERREVCTDGGYLLRGGKFVYQNGYVLRCERFPVGEEHE